MIYYIKDKNKKKDKQGVTLEIPKCVVDYNDSVIAYLDAINSGNVSLDKVNCVIKNVDTLRENKEITFRQLAKTLQRTKAAKKAEMDVKKNGYACYPFFTVTNVNTVVTCIMIVRILPVFSQKDYCS